MNRFHRKNLLLDTNLLLLLLVGSFDPSKIRTHKITANQGFNETDFNQLRNFVCRFQKLVTTPHILTEVSNHADKGVDKGRFLHQFLSLIEKMDERFETSQSLAKTDAFVRFGLADAAISHLANGNFIVLTVDYCLAGYLQKKGVRTINFNIVRGMPQIVWVL
jgi:rRNA-processing protein FCF1